MEDSKRVADYFIIAGLPPTPEQNVINEDSLEISLKPSHNQDPITDITVIFPGLGENVPDYYQILDTTPSGLPADLNHGSFRAPEAFICFRRGKEIPPLVDLGVLYESQGEIPRPGYQLVEFTPNGHTANINNSTNSAIYLNYRRAADVSPCNEMVITELAIIITSKGEEPPHSFVKVSKNLNKSMVGSDVYLCFKKSLNRPEHISFKPVLLDRFPVSNQPSFPLEDNVALFCLPMGATLECWPTEAIRTTTTSTFVLTMQNYERVYGSVISFYEDYDEANLTATQRSQLKLDLWRNPEDRKIITKKCIALLSKWPFFDAFEKFLFFLYKRVLMGPHDLPVERYIAHFLYNVPFPSPERPRILVQVSKTDIIALYHPHQLALPRSGASFRLLLTTLGPENSSQLLLLALTEQKVLIHSLRPNVLTAVCEAMMQMIFPFTWQCPYIPLCPVGMSSYLSAPFPFIIGLDTRFFDLYELPPDVNAVDLDSNTISLCDLAKHVTTKLLPKRFARNLKATLTELQEKCIHYNRLAQEIEITSDEALDFEFKLREKEANLEAEIQEAFLKFMAGIMSGYRLHLLPITRAPGVGVTDVSNLFDENNFLRTRDRYYHQFYKMLLHTQLFTKFIEECSFVSDVNQNLAFFDECCERLEREEDSHLLLDTEEGSTSDTTVFILPPDGSDLPQGVEYKYTVLSKLDHSLFPPIPPPCTGGSSEGVSNVCSTPHNRGTHLNTPPTSLAKRTKHEIRSAAKMAKKNAEHPLLWAKCLLTTCYSVWYLALPAMALEAEGALSILRTGYSILQRMQKLRMNPVDEICYRVMMQLCDLYHQPVLAVKILFEMKRHGIHPNAVTYGYYNKAVLESEWPQGIASGSQLLWHKLRNVLTAVWLFKRAGKASQQTSEADPNSREGSHLDVQLENDQVGSSRSQLTATPDSAAGGPSSSAALDKEANGAEAEGEAAKSATGALSTANGDDVDGKELTKGNEEPPEQTKLTRTKSMSIVKPTPREDDEGDDVEDSVDRRAGLHDQDLGLDRRHQHHTSLDRVEEESEEGVKPKVVRYTEIRTKFPNLIRPGPAKSLFATNKSTDDRENPKERPEEDDPEITFRFQRPDLDEDEDVDSGVRQLDGTPVTSRRPNQDVNSLSTPKANNLNFVPVTKDDPLGALESSDQSHPDQFRTPIKEKGASDLTHRSMSMSDVLGGEPFRTPQAKTVGNRSSTMPLRGDLGGSNTELSTVYSNGSIVGSLSTLAGSGLKSLAGSKAANLGMRKGKALLGSVVSSFSPQNNTATKSALNTIKSWSTSVKRYGEMVSPAVGPDYLEEDRQSQDSNDSRRTSEAVSTPHYAASYHQEQQQENWSESWSSFLWGEPQRTGYNTQTQTSAQKTNDFTEQFENLYARANNEEKDLALAMVVTITSCSRCRKCEHVLFDEEIMAGWSPEDSNLNTKCPFCDASTVPSLTVNVADYRTHPKDTCILSQPTTTSTSTCPEGGNKQTSVGQGADKDTNSNNAETECLTSGDNSENASKEINVKDSVPNEEEPSTGVSQSDAPSAKSNSEAKLSSTDTHPLSEGLAATESSQTDAGKEDASGSSGCVDKKSSSHRQQLPTPHHHPHITVPYISPLVLRKELESVLEKEGDRALISPSCPDLHPILYWNLLYFFHRIATPSHLPGLLLGTPSLVTPAPTDPSWEGAHHTSVKVITRWDNEAQYTERLPLHMLWRHRKCEMNSKTVHPLMQNIISGVKENDLLGALKAILTDRQNQAERLRQQAADASGQTLPSSPAFSNDMATPPSRMSQVRLSYVPPSQMVSVYRDSLFLTLVALGQDNIDLTAFDREYRKAFEKLDPKRLSQAAPCDRPPNSTTVFCRKLFRELRV